MDFKLLGSILLIVGTSIGAGMLALPIATAQLGFWGSLVLLFGCWFVMTAGALLILEVNLWLPQNSNLISMARATIGPVGQVIAWVVYMLLLYSLLCAYIAGGSDLLHNLFAISGMQVPLMVTAIGFVLFLSGIVFCGIRMVDYANRGLMFFKLGSYLLLVLLLMPHITLYHLAAGHFTKLTSVTAIMVTITSFGFATIVPSLRIYFHGDVKKLKQAIIIGSLIPLFCYIVWDAVIMGVIPLEGDNSLLSIIDSANTTSDLVNTLNILVSQPAVVLFVKLFTSIAVVTSFLGVGLCLTDFLADGLKMEKVGGNKALIHALTFLPPLGIVLISPNIFVSALAYGGIYSVILLILLPAWMAWQGRYRLQLAKGYRMAGGKLLLGGLILFSVALTIYGLLREP